MKIKQRFGKNAILRGLNFEEGTTTPNVTNECRRTQGMTHDYDDIINLPHHEPKHHQGCLCGTVQPSLPPFAALTGYDATITKSNRLTDDWVGLSESGNEK